MRKAKNTWVLAVGGAVSVAVVIAVVSLDAVSAPIEGVVRVAALLGYLAVFLAGLSSNYMRELTRYFGRPFVKIHHIVSVTALLSLLAHAISAVQHWAEPKMLLPSFTSARVFFSFGGSPALLLIATAALAALLRSTIGRNWKIVHWLNYIAFFLATAHAQLIGGNFQHLGVRVVSFAMAAALVAVFVNRRVVAQRRRRR